MLISKHDKMFGLMKPDKYSILQVNTMVYAAVFTYVV